MKSEFRYLLDTDISSYIIRRIPKPLSRAMQFGQQFAISSITRFELGRARGELRLDKSRLLLDSFLAEVPTLDFDDESADAGSEIFTKLEAQGKRIGIADSMIAGQALSTGLVLVTNNQRHFDRIPELRTQNWMQ
jgi:tRNA(fMet)-specific endonuclease VapC